MNEPKREPILNAPGVVVGLIVAFVAIHAARELTSTATDNRLVELLAFNPARYGGDADVPGGPWVAPLAFLSHAMLHGDWAHLGINSAWLLAVGTPIARRMPAGSFLAFFALCAAGGALMFLALHPGLDAAIVGASGAISGLMAAMFRLIFAAGDGYSTFLLREQPLAAARLSVRSMLTRPRPRMAILVWLVVNFVGALAMGFSSSSAIAWEAHLGGFIVGLTALDLLDRGNPHEQPDARD